MKMSALLFPGGFGAAKSLSNFALGDNLEVDPGVERVIKHFNEAKKTYWSLQLCTNTGCKSSW